MRRAVITGAGQGLGKAIATRLAADGLEIVALDIDGAAAQSTAAELGGEAHQVDVRDLDAIEALAAEIGAVDVLVNNAGIWHKLSLADSTPNLMPTQPLSASNFRSS